MKPTVTSGDTYQKVKISFIITALGIGGAEMMLLRLLKCINYEKYDVQVVTLRPSGALEKEIISLGIPLQTARMESPLSTISGVIRLRSILLESNPDIVFCWMYHANLLGGIAAKLSGIPHILWNIRNSGLAFTWKDTLTMLVIKLGALFSTSIPSMIVVNSETARSNHIRMGYSDENIQVIYNGIDVSEFKPNKDAREKIRRELEIDEDELLVGMAARFNPQKDHLNFIRAARIINDRNPDVRFILCGRGVDGNNKQITTWIDENGLKDKISLLGEKRNLASLYNAWDINVLSSCGESFPNVIAEAMSCGVPCAATDVGDSAMIIGDTGMVVPPGDSASLAGAVLKLLKNEKLRQSLGKKARERIIDLFSLQNISEQYEKLLDDEMKNK